MCDSSGLMHDTPSPAGQGRAQTQGETCGVRSRQCQLQGKLNKVSSLRQAGLIRLRRETRTWRLHPHVMSAPLAPLQTPLPPVECIVPPDVSAFTPPPHPASKHPTSCSAARTPGGISKMAAGRGTPHPPPGLHSHLTTPFPRGVCTANDPSPLTMLACHPLPA
jgi:hypothetical protein